MLFRVSDALASGVERTLARNGLTLVIVFYVLFGIQSLFSPSPSSIGGGNAPPSIGSGAAPTPVVGGPVVGGLVATVASLAGLYLMIVALRTFVTDETETIPSAALYDRPLWAFLNALVGLVVFGLLVAIGFVFLIVPGLFLLVSLWFFTVYVAVENDDFVTAMQRSWSLTSGHRLGLFGLGFVVFVVTIAISIPFSIVTAFIGGVPGALISQIGTAFATVFSYATTAAAFTQLRASQAPRDEHSESADWDASTNDRSGYTGAP